MQRSRQRVNIKKEKIWPWAREGEREEAVVAAWRHAFDATDPPSSK